MCLSLKNGWTGKNPGREFPLYGGRCHNLKNGKEASADTEESPAGCAGEGKQSKIN